MFLRRYIQATLVDHNRHAAAALTCRDPRLDSIEQWGRDIAALRQRPSPRVLTVEVTDYADTAAGNRVTATADVAATILVDGRPRERLTRPYTVTIVEQNGWKVCHATITQP